MARNVYLAQVNNKFGENKVFFPYSVGLLQAYAKSQPDLKGAYRFARPLFMRNTPSVEAQSLGSPDVLGISTYIWNAEWSYTLAREVRARNPNTLIVLGGPQIPDRSDGFFQAHPEVDLLVHNEGEHTFSDILRERLRPEQNYLGIPGLTVNQDGTSVKNPTRPRLTEEEIAALPSPYLSGEFDGLLRDFSGLEFHVTSETHRGCPFKCTFCQWGSYLMAKVKRFPDERIIAEYLWAAKNRIPMIYNADANFGMFPRDEPLTDRLIEIKGEFGFPQQLRANWAKNSHDRMYNMAKKLTEAGMGVGVTLSFQSLNKEVLEIIKRENIKFDHFEELIAKYEAVRIPTYTEMILALAGETYETFTGGLETLFSGGQHDGINIYLCTLLPNAEMNNPEYIAAQGIRSIRSPILQNHATPGEDPIQEFADTVIATNTMPKKDFRRAILFSWTVQALQSMGPTRDIANYLKSQGVSYQQFYEGLISESPDAIIGQQVAMANRSLDRALAGGEWSEIDQRYGNITWPIEEKIFLDIATGDIELFYRQIEMVVGKRFVPIPKDILEGQKARLRTPKDFGGNIPEYAKRVAWFGRKFGYALKDANRGSSDSSSPLKELYTELDSMQQTEG